MSASRREGVRPQTTVMFADLSGFTALSERLDPEAATDLVDHWFAGLEAIVVACGGLVDKYIGDCIVAVWDLDDAAASARQAARAACAIRGVVGWLNESMPAPEPLDVHIGLGSGPLIAGHVGGELSGTFSVVGEPVSVAECIGERSGRGQILVDGATHAAGGAAFACRALDPMTLPQRTNEVSVFELCGLVDGDAGALPELVQTGIARAAARLAGADPIARDAARGSERRHATIVFAEVTGFELLDHVTETARYSELLNRCFNALEPAVHAHGGVVDKYVGATVMALFGVPYAIEHAPRQALNAAIDMRKCLQRFLVAEGLAGRLHLRVGVNTGLVIAGELGGGAARAFTVIGDAVNIAARLKAAAAHDAVYVGRETHRHTRDHFAFDALPPLALKGKTERTSAWRLLSDREQVHRTSADTVERAIGSALVGRERELAMLADAVRHVIDGRGGIVGVIGDAGIGKSRLMAELFALPALQHACVLEGRSLSMGHGLSFHPFIDLLRRWAGIAANEAPPEASAKLAAAVRELLPEMHDEHLPFIARLMGLRVQGALADRVQGLEGEAMEEMIFRAMRELLERLAEQRPLVLAFEDLHWADHSSIKLLESLLRLVASHPVLILAVGRPDSPETLGRVLDAARAAHPAQLTEIALRRLTDEQCDTLIQNLLRTDRLPYATRALVIRKAEGNPFYIEEVIRSFIDAGAVEYRNGRFHLTRKIDAVEVPGTIEEVILARVDRLDEGTRHVLQVAAVIGRSAHHRILADVLDGMEALDTDLAVLQAKQLIVARKTRRTALARRRTLQEETEYVFTHALGQEAIYSALLHRTRKELHRRVAASIERVFADRLVDFYGMLAYHYSRAEDFENAEQYLFKAGEEAARAAASSEALAYFREASQLYVRIHGAGGDARKKALLEKNLALALLNTGALTESIEHFDNALGHLGWPVPRGSVARTLAQGRSFLLALRQLYFWAGRRRHVADWDRERALWEVLFNRGRAEITSDPTRLFFDTVTGFTRLNRIDAAQIDQASAIYASCAAVFCYSGISFAVARKALAAAKRLVRPGNVRDEFTCAEMEWVLHYLEGDWTAHYDIADDMIDEALRHGQLWDVNTYVGLYADMKLRRGEFAAASALIERLADLNGNYGYRFAGTNHDSMVMLLRLEQRRLPEALAAAEHYQSARHEDALKVLGLGSKAKAQVLLGDLDGAAASLAAAQRITQRSREVPPWHRSAYAAARLRFDLALLEQDATPAPALRRRARRSARAALALDGKAAIQRSEIQQLCGAVYWLLGQRRRALRCWRRSLASGVAMGARPELARTYALLSERLQAGARIDGLSAAECRERALGEFSALGLRWDHARLAGGPLSGTRGAAGTLPHSWADPNDSGEQSRRRA